MTKPKKLKRLAARLLLDLSTLNPEFPNSITWGVDCQHAIWVVYGDKSNKPPDQYRAKFSPRFNRNWSDRFQILRIKGLDQRSIVVPNPGLTIGFIQPTETGFLLADSLCDVGQDGTEPNAVEYNWYGQEVQRLVLGYGILDLRTTPGGSIWAGYFDEGIFSDALPGYGCIGASGLVCFDSKGKVTQKFDRHKAGGDGIWDAYAVNVTGDGDVWTCYYHAFPIVNVHRGSYRVWEYGIGGAEGLAVDGDRVLLTGGYDQRQRLRIVQLGADGKAVVRTEKLLVNESGAFLKSRHMFGVGKNLYILRRRKIYVLDEW